MEVAIDDSKTRRLCRLRQLKPLPNTCWVQSPTQPPLELQHQVKNSMWMTKEWQSSGAQKASVTEQGRFAPLRRGLRKCSLPLEPAFTTTSAALAQTVLATTEIR